MAAVISGSFFYYALPVFGQMYHLIRKFCIQNKRQMCLHFSE